MWQRHITRHLDKRTDCHIRNGWSPTSPRSREDQLLENSVYNYDRRTARAAFLYRAGAGFLAHDNAATEICNSQQASLEKRMMIAMLLYTLQPVNDIGR